MFPEDLQQQRAAKWRTNGLQPVRTLEDAQAFLDSVGFCLFYPQRPAITAPTFIGAVLGSTEDLPIANKAAVDPRTADARSLALRLLDQKLAFEVPFGESGSLLVSPAEFPYFYSLIGERNPKSVPPEGVRGEKALMSHTFRLLQQSPSTETELLEKLGKAISESALLRALHGLWEKLRIARVDVFAAGSPKWDVLYRVAPQPVNRGAHLSHAEALSALIGRYLETVIAVDLKEIEAFFGHITARSRAAEVVRALTAAREIENIKVGHASMLRLVPREPEKTEDLGARQVRSLEGERRQRPDAMRKMVMRDDRRNPRRNDRRDDRRDNRRDDRPGDRPRRSPAGGGRRPNR